MRTHALSCAQPDDEAPRGASRARPRGAGGGAGRKREREADGADGGGAEAAGGAGAGGADDPLAALRARDAHAPPARSAPCVGVRGGPESELRGHTGYLLFSVRPPAHTIDGPAGAQAAAAAPAGAWGCAGAGAAQAGAGGPAREGPPA